MGKAACDNGAGKAGCGAVVCLHEAHHPDDGLLQ